MKPTSQAEQIKILRQTLNEGVRLIEGNELVSKTTKAYNWAETGRAAIALSLANGGEAVTLERAADFLEWYVGFIKESVMSVDIERHPYLPELEDCAKQVRALSIDVAAQPPKEAVKP